MGMRTGRRGFRALFVTLLVVAPVTAYAHSRLVTPVPRDLSDAHKTGPCGGLARTATYTQLDSGATIQVKFREGIDHAGCFQVALSQGDDQNFVTLTQIVDDGGTANTDYTLNVKLPSGVTCANCTLQLRQLMQGTAANPGPPCAADASPDLAINGTYYSCADIRIGSFPDAGGTVVDPEAGAGGSSGSSGGSDDDAGDDPSADPSGTSSGATRHPGGIANPGACSVAWGASSGLSLAAALGLIGVALVRRRRRSR